MLLGMGKYEDRYEREYAYAEARRERESVAELRERVVRLSLARAEVKRERIDLAMFQKLDAQVRAAERELAERAR